MDPSHEPRRGRDLLPDRASTARSALFAPLENLGIIDTFPDFDFSKDFSGLSWRNPPSIGALEYGGIFFDDFESGDSNSWTVPVW